MRKRSENARADRQTRATSAEGHSGRQVGGNAGSSGAPPAGSTAKRLKSWIRRHQQDGPAVSAAYLEQVTGRPGGSVQWYNRYFPYLFVMQ